MFCCSWEDLQSPKEEDKKKKSSVEHTPSLARHENQKVPSPQDHTAPAQAEHHWLGTRECEVWGNIRFLRIPKHEAWGCQHPTAFGFAISGRAGRQGMQGAHSPAPG